jgi:hypothetical protein
MTPTSLEDVYADIEARFLLTLPDEELSEERLFFQLEQAHWFYEDFYADEWVLSLTLTRAAPLHLPPLPVVPCMGWPPQVPPYHSPHEAPGIR